MKIMVRLFANFSSGRFSSEIRDYPSGTTPAQIAVDLAIPEDELGIILVNNQHVELDVPLGDGDHLSLFPLLGGG